MQKLFFFFFSSRRRHTRSLCDWSSDVCSSDLEVLATHAEHRGAQPLGAKEPASPELTDLGFPLPPQVLVALDRLARRRNDPPAVHRPFQLRPSPARISSSSSEAPG